ncbi:MAG: hypothetical protein R3318_00085 [Gammaproteobacteria bacterium]|nr:hypothetical protein [Gammaproteobacteria bacterium]
MEQFAELKQLLIDSLNQFVQNLGSYLPNIFGAIVLVITGLVVAWLVKWLILRLGAGLDRLLQTLGMASLNARLKWPLANIIGWVFYAIIILITLRAALASLKLPSLAELLGRLITSLPALLITVVIIFGGVVLGNALRDRILANSRSIGIQQAEMLGHLIRVTIITLAVIAGLTQIGLDVRLFENILVILIAAIFGAIGLAFGLGAGPTVSNIISTRYVRKNYQVDQEIRIHDMEGKILEILPTGVILETDNGRTFIPGKVFDEEASVLLDHKSFDDD